MVGVCKTCGIVKNVIITRNRKLKDGTRVRDLHCHDCKRHLMANFKPRNKEQVLEHDRWNKRAWDMVHKLSKKYGNKHAKSK